MNDDTHQFIPCKCHSTILYITHTTYHIPNVLRVDHYSINKQAKVKQCEPMTASIHHHSKHGMEWNVKKMMNYTEDINRRFIFDKSTKRILFIGA